MIREFKSAVERRKFLEKQLGIDLSHIGISLLDQESSVHCENLIGAVSIPLGVAGPVEITGEDIRGEFYIPLATTEGALVASVNRGCKAVNQSGGVYISVDKIGATRGPVFYTGSIEASQRLSRWIQSHDKELKEVAKKTSKHLHYLQADVKVFPDHVFVRCYFDTDQAMGMNMVTIATDAIVRLIESKTGIHCTALAGNFDIDKKPAWLNFDRGRGYRLLAEVVVHKTVVQNILKTTPETLYQTWFSKCIMGSVASGSLGFNAHYANIIAAFFAATGQDLAHVVEGSMGLTTTKLLQSGDMYFSVFLPAVMLGTVGGGNNLKTQQEAKAITKLTRSSELAAILAAAVLSGELSLLASISAGTLAPVHKRLGR